MTELTENSVLRGPVEPQEFVTAAVKDEILLTEAFETTLQISQDVTAASEETDCKQKLEQEDGQLDGQTVSEPAAESSSTESKWVVGAQCRAVWSEDGRLYPATVMSLDGQRCRVRFSGYGNEGEVELSTLKSPEAALQTQNSQEWKPGSRCRAVYSEDGLVYPAVILWVKGQRCRVRFDDYNNEEEQEVSSLLTPDELHGPSRATAAKVKGSSWKSSGSSSDWRRSRREENQRERGGERRSPWRDDQQNSSWVKEKSSSQSKVDKDAEEKSRGAERPTNQSFPYFPPFPPPPQSSSGDPGSFIPPPPPLWMFGEKESKSFSATSSMLMLWYMCGFHTGSYLAQQEFKSSSKQ
uniref:survival of motor neuron protein-like isoform X3 n=1 Tax=Scatophagus argus TaxID=75038 RepID=UPI001ED8198A|nr:survival of motor neuron protein-like isoform X3 [Scatophagus argus]